MPLLQAGSERIRGPALYTVWGPMFVLIRSLGLALSLDTDVFLEGMQVQVRLLLLPPG